jgi:hypothetical protein
VNFFIFLGYFKGGTYARTFQKVRCKKAAFFNEGEGDGAHHTEGTLSLIRYKKYSFRACLECAARAVYLSAMGEGRFFIGV